MAEWSEEHEVAIGSLNSNIDLIDGLWLNWRPGGAIRWKVKTVSWKGRGVVCEKPSPSRL
jgi:hypothetical protein